MSLFNPDQIPHLLDRDGWAILRAERAHLSPERNKARVDLLRTWLKQAHIPHLAAEGCYGGVKERSFVLLGVTEAEALALARRFRQESILTRRGLVYTDGRGEAPTGLPVVVSGRVRDGYTKLRKSGVKFTIPFEA